MTNQYLSFSCGKSHPLPGFLVQELGSALVAEAIARKFKHQGKIASQREREREREGGERERER